MKTIAASVIVMQENSLTFAAVRWVSKQQTLDSGIIPTSAVADGSDRTTI
jgi:hypothetical protein